MNIEGIELKEHKEGWVVRIPYEGFDNQKPPQPKTHYNEHFYPNLQQCLGKVRDSLAKEFASVLDLIELFKAATDIDRRILRVNGLLRPPLRQRHKIDEKGNSCLEELRWGRWVNVATLIARPLKYLAYQLRR